MRKYTLFMGALAIGALAAGCGDRGRDGTVGTSGSTNVPGGSAMTLRGCVESGSPAGTYVLRTAVSPEVTGETAGTSGSNRRSGSNVNGTFLNQGNAVYRLIATGSLDIGQNLGKEVTVTGEVATQARDNTGAATSSGAAGESGAAGNSGAAANTGQSGDRTQRRPPGEGDHSTNLESGSSQGSGNGRIQGSAPDRAAPGQFFRVTSMTKVADICGSGESAGPRNQR